MIRTEYTDHRVAASVAAKYHPEKGQVDLHFESEGKNLLVVTIPLKQLALLYRNIDQECRAGSKPFAPVRID